MALWYGLMLLARIGSEGLLPGRGPARPFSAMRGSPSPGPGVPHRPLPPVRDSGAARGPEATCANPRPGRRRSRCRCMPRLRPAGPWPRVGGGAPAPDEDGTPSAAVAVSLTDSRFEPGRLAELGRVVSDTAAEITARRLG